MASSQFLKTKAQSIHIRSFETQESTTNALLIHGSLEDGRIFYSKSGKGLAPYFQNHGHNVYVPDFQGRGESSPHPKELDKGHDEILLEDIPHLIDLIFE
jgi:pimeloyl-ACP methyl ester carboxylesterase